MVEIRGRHPYTQRRKVCPTCMADRLVDINNMSNSNYGACEVPPNDQAEPLPPDSERGRHSKL